jgi:hypothetical protein
MKERTGCSARWGILVLCGLLLYPSLSYAQQEQTRTGAPDRQGLDQRRPDRHGIG